MTQKKNPQADSPNHCFLEDDVYFNMIQIMRPTVPVENSYSPKPILREAI